MSIQRSSINLHHLHVFHSVAATGGIRRSAEVLHRASSAVARSIGALEDSLNAALFERKGRGMLLTAAGDIVRTRARHIEAELADVRNEAARMASRAGAGPVGALDTLFNETRLTAASLLAEMHHMPSVAKAAGLSQPAVSNAIARLESALMQPLFVRTARGVLPTDAGARWVVQFERVLAELRNIEADVAALNGVLEGVVTVGALPLARTRVLPAAISALLASHPKLMVRSLESPYADLCGGLLSGKIDFILGALRPRAGAELATESLFADPTALIVGANHPLAGRAIVGFADLEGFPWVLSRAGTPLRESLRAFFGRHGREEPQAAVETGDLALVRALLLQGDMLTALSPHQLHYEIESGSLVVLPFALTGMQADIGITTRAGAHLSGAAQALLDKIRQASAQLIR